MWGMTWHARHAMPRHFTPGMRVYNEGDDVACWPRHATPRHELMKSGYKMWGVMTWQALCVRPYTQGVDAADVPAAAAAAAAASSASPTASLVPAFSFRAASVNAAAAPAAPSTSQARPAPRLPLDIPAVVFPRLSGGASMLQEDDNSPEVGRCRFTPGPPQVHPRLTPG